LGAEFQAAAGPERDLRYRERGLWETAAGFEAKHLAPIGPPDLLVLIKLWRAIRIRAARQTYPHPQGMDLWMERGFGLVSLGCRWPA